jgi:hypothetical protein
MREDPLQDERLRLREDAKRLLRVSYERQTAQGGVGLRVDLGAGAKERGLSADSPHLASLVDYMEVAGWIKPDPGAFDFADGPIRMITGRGVEVLREE